MQSDINMNLAQEEILECINKLLYLYTSCILHTLNTCIKAKKTYEEQVKTCSQGTIRYYLLVKYHINSRGVAFREVRKYSPSGPSS